MTVNRIGRVVGGWTLLAVGAALLVLPGPGLLVIAGGLALLATEYDWAASLLTKTRERLAAIRVRKSTKSRNAAHDGDGDARGDHGGEPADREAAGGREIPGRRELVAADRGLAEDGSPR
ncbi:MAG TPA: PGPGW domain-containing protein [Pseudonocardiaceae bacterium]|nr:PGPGW domain-containing protein [Pseudonocardiaceae bacterium]